MHSFLLLHFIQGSYYPRGGSSEIAYNIIPVIEGAGGRVLVRVKVNSIIIEDGTAVGVSVTKGKNQHELYAPIIISNAGLMNTVNKLLPPDIVKEHKMDKLIKKVKPGPAFLMIFIGLDGTKEELGLKAQNVWAFKDADLETIVERYFSLSPEDSQTSDVPLMFLSFPSAKDPTFNLRYPGKSTCAIVTVTPYHWFQEWKDEKVKHRGEDYESFKSHFGRKLWEQVLCMYPQLDGKLEYIEVGTPLSNQYYLESFNGEVYGLDHDVTRFNPSMQMELRAETPIPGLFMSGQDTFTDGLSGALYSGLFTASAILKHNILAELFQLRSLWKAKNKSA
jgi:all-trans-retinol 13,14-reductase